jgi:site-specific recombinase XerD
MSVSLTEGALSGFREFLTCSEKSENTLQKYLRDAKTFLSFLQNRPVSKEITVAYKERLIGLYAVSSVNSMLAALNAFLEFTGAPGCKVKPLRTQRALFASEDRQLSRKNYEKMIALAKARGKDRLRMAMQTLCNTGVRISELPFITAEAVRQGRAAVSCKGKIREIFIHDELRQMLLAYIKDKGIRSGPVFVTKTGKPVNRSNLWREMRALSRGADVDQQKVFPHNLRHLFARTYYRLKKDIARLADILGHSNIQTTRVYIMTSGSEYRRELGGLGLLVT